MSTTASIPESDSNCHEYKRYSGSGHRSPCPALNSLANHGYMFVDSDPPRLPRCYLSDAAISSRNGRDLTFFEVVDAIVLVYNLTYPLSIFLTLVGFITCGHVAFLGQPSEDPSRTSARSPTRNPPWILRSFEYLYDLVMRFVPRMSLHLSSLSERGGFKIAHDASFVHPNGLPSESPDPVLVQNLLDYASELHELDGKSTGLGLVDVARYHAQRVKLSPSPLGSIHRQIALGECALTWKVLRGNWRDSVYDGSGLTSSTKEPEGGSSSYGVIPVFRLEQWFGEERLPDGWWDIGNGGIRPIEKIGIIRTRILANLIGSLAGGSG